MSKPTYQSIGGILVKRCSTCWVTRELEHFHSNASRHDGLDYQCVQCSNLADKARHRRTATSGAMPA